MIDRICGLLIEKQAPSLIIDTGSIAYEVICPMSVFYNLPNINDQVKLFTHFVVREDAQLLYGFNSKADRDAFRQIIKINGIGAKIALAILSKMNLPDLIECINQQDNNGLLQVPGIGKKTSERLLVELRNKFSKIDILTDNHIRQEKTVFDFKCNVKYEALQALQSLGYKKKDAENMLAVFSRSDYNSTEDLIKLVLKQTL